MNPYDHQTNERHQHTIRFGIVNSFGSQDDAIILMIEQAVHDTSNVVWAQPETTNNVVSLQVIANRLRIIADLLGIDDNICDDGLSEETISKHLDVSIKQGRTSGSCEDGEGDICAVCLDEYEEKQTIGSLKCGHRYHEECIKGWLLRKNVCPMCRAIGLTV